MHMVFRAGSARRGADRRRPFLRRAPARQALLPRPCSSSIRRRASFLTICRGRGHRN